MTSDPSPAEFAEHAGDHRHADVSGGALRAAVFGAMDGLVTTIALVAGVGGGGAAPAVILLSGLAGVVAGAFSMALGEFASVDAQNDSVRREVALERSEILRHPNAERAELQAMYQQMGLSPATAEAMAREVHADPDLAVRVHLIQEVGVDPAESPSPWTAAISSFVCFTVGGLVPLASYLVGSTSLVVSLGIGGLGLFAAGALTARFTTRRWWLSGLRQLLFGAVAAGATFIVGSLIGTTLG